MTTFLQFHILTPYGLSNPNRDDQGRPKQAMIGGSPRLRMSSQSVKRALRESTFFALDLADNRGTRTKRLHDHLLARLIATGQGETKAAEIAEQVAAVFGKLETPDKGEVQRHATTLAFISPAEWTRAEELADKAAAGEPLPDKKELTKEVLRRADGAVDIAMFGKKAPGITLETSKFPSIDFIGNRWLSQHIDCDRCSIFIAHPAIRAMQVNRKRATSQVK